MKDEEIVEIKNAVLSYKSAIDFLRTQKEEIERKFKNGEIYIWTMDSQIEHLEKEHRYSEARQYYGKLLSRTKSDPEYEKNLELYFFKYFSI